MFVDEASGTYAGHGFEAVTSTIRTPGYDLLERCRLDHRIAKVEYPTRKTSLGCSYDGGEFNK